MPLLEIASLRKELNDFKFKLDEMRQYSRRNCLKITGIPKKKTKTLTNWFWMSLTTLFSTKITTKSPQKTFQDHTELASLTLVAARQETLLSNSLATGRGPEFTQIKKTWNRTTETPPNKRVPSSSTKPWLPDGLNCMEKPANSLRGKRLTVAGHTTDESLSNYAVHEGRK